MTRSDILPWLDRRGRFSSLRLAVFTAGIGPAAWLLWLLWSGQLGAEPIKAAMHLTGEWTLYALLASLAISPLRRLLGWGALIGVRRMVGLTAFACVLAHFTLYILLENLDLVKVAREIILRTYLTIGFVALLGLAALAATSFDAAIRRMGRGWQRLHRLSYLLTAMGILHFFMQAKLDVAGAALLAGVFAALMLYRLTERPLRGRIVPEIPVLLIAVQAGATGAGLEYLWHLTQTGIPADRVLLSNFDFRYDVRYPWIVMAIIAAPVPVMLARRAVDRFRPAYPPEAARNAS